MPQRRDDAGQLWTREQVDAEVCAIVARLAGWETGRVTRATTFGPKGLAWDRIARLSVIKPIRGRLHERLDDGVVITQVNRVGQLCDYVWALMEAVA